MLRFALSRLRAGFALAAVSVLSIASASFVASPARAEMELYLQSPIVQALLNHDYDQLRRQLFTGTNPNSVDGEGQPLIVLAARKGLAPAIPLLLENRARVDEADRFGNTALMWAADQGHVDIVSQLLAAGASVNNQNRQGLTPLIRAARAGDTRILKMLLDAGADVELADYTGRDALSWAQEGGNSRAIRLLEEIRGR